MDLFSSAGNMNLNSESERLRIVLTDCVSSSKERNCGQCAHKVFFPCTWSCEVLQATVRLLLRVWPMDQVYHMMHGNQGNQEIKVLHRERKGNLHRSHSNQQEPRWGFGLCSLQPSILLYLYIYISSLKSLFMYMHLLYMHHDMSWGI